MEPGDPLAPPIAGIASVIRVDDITFLANLSGGQTSRVVFTNVLHAPGIVSNFISDKNGLRMMFCDGVARMELKTDGTLDSQGRLNERNLYSFNGTVVSPAQQQSMFALSATHTSFPSVLAFTQSSLQTCSMFLGLSGAARVRRGV